MLEHTLTGECGYRTDHSEDMDSDDCCCACLAEARGDYERDEQKDAKEATDA